MTQLTATFTVTIRTKPDGDYYFDHDDLVRNVVPWIEGGLDDRDDIAEVTITEQPAAVSAAVAPPTNHTALSDREKAMLSFALEITQEEIHARSLDLADDDKAALVSLRRMADETATQTPAPDQIRTVSNDCCGAEPPQDGTWGDCWCTLPPNHDGKHRCQPCTDRHSAPGWTDQPAAGARQDGTQP